MVGSCDGCSKKKKKGSGTQSPIHIKYHAFGFGGKLLCGGKYGLVEVNVNSKNHQNNNQKTQGHGGNWIFWLLGKDTADIAFASCKKDFEKKKYCLGLTRLFNELGIYINSGKW